MIECATSENAELVIVSRDSDFGAVFDNRAYINDHLKQEFSDRVSKKRKLLLYTRLSEALKHFAVPVTEKEAEAESEIVEVRITTNPDPNDRVAHLIEIFKRLNAEQESTSEDGA